MNYHATQKQTDLTDTTIMTIAFDAMEAVRGGDVEVREFTTRLKRAYATADGRDDRHGKKRLRFIEGFLGEQLEARGDADLANTLNIFYG